MSFFGFTAYAAESLLRFVSSLVFWIFSVSGSQVLYNLGVGSGALMGGAAGAKILIDLWNQRKRRRSIEKYIRLYPRNFLEKEDGWKLVRNSITGHIYILDHRNHSYRWIANWDTLMDLGLKGGWEQFTDEKAVFQNYIQGSHILTVGKPEP